MIGQGTAIAIVLGVFGLIFAMLKLIEKTLHPHPEILRKLFHVGMGLVVISFPWAFTDRWPILLLAGVSVVLLLIVKYLPSLHDSIGTVLFEVRRPSLGEICFPIAVASLVLLSGNDKLLFVIPMLIMTLADTTAALIGISYGRIRYITSEGLKSVEGSIAFFTIAFFSVHVPLLLFTDIGRPQTLLIAGIIGLLSMLIEAIAWRGLDNLLIPIGALAFLRIYMHATPASLVLRLGATILLLMMLLIWRRRSSLDDSALMACALFGYAAWMLGGWMWLIGPSVLFLVHVWMWPRQGERRAHHSYAVLSVTFAGLFWLGMHVARDDFLFPYAVSFGAHLAIIGVSRIAAHRSNLSNAGRVARSIAGGWVLSIVQMMSVWFSNAPALGSRMLVSMLLAAFGSITLAAIAYYFLLPRLYGHKGSELVIHTAGGVLGFLGSLLAASIVIPF